MGNLALKYKNKINDKIKLHKSFEEKNGKVMAGLEIQ